MARGILETRQALLILNGLPNIGPITMNRLLAECGGAPEQVFEMKAEALVRTRGVGPVIRDTLLQWREHFDPERERRLMEESATSFVVPADAAYPKWLREIHDPPIGLYQRGHDIGDLRCVAIVGSRRMTPYGHSVASELGAELARLGICVVSGLARGIDTAAHLGALNAGGRTAAVLGCGIDIVYPPENIGLLRRIEKEGTLLSEFPFTRRADRQSFAMRNRVVSGMCSAVVVVETDIDGGSMITAKFAGDQGRSVFAVPGRIDQQQSRGCHQLIREGATLYSGLDDLLEDLDYLKGLAPRGLGKKETPPRPMPEGEAGQVWTCFAGADSLSVDEIADRTLLGPAVISGALLTLELAGYIAKRLDGAYEVRGGR